MAQVQLTTDIKSYARGQVTGTTTLTARTTTLTQPASSSTRLLVGSSLNYLKVKLLTEASSVSSPVVYVYGWSFMPDTMAFVPQLLAQFSFTLTAGSASFPSVTNVVYEAASYTLQQGDMKIYNGTAATGNGGFVLIDTLGCQFIEFNVVEAGTPVCHILTAGL
jgi:hypothetical protein